VEVEDAHREEVKDVHGEEVKDVHEEEVEDVHGEEVEDAHGEEVEDHQDIDWHDKVSCANDSACMGKKTATAIPACMLPTNAQYAPHFHVDAGSHDVVLLESQ